MSIITHLVMETKNIVVNGNWLLYLEKVGELVEEVQHFDTLFFSVFSLPSLFATFLLSVWQLNCHCQLLAVSRRRFFYGPIKNLRHINTSCKFFWILKKLSQHVDRKLHCLVSFTRVSHLSWSGAEHPPCGGVHLVRLPPSCSRNWFRYYMASKPSTIVTPWSFG